MDRVHSPEKHQPVEHIGFIEASVLFDRTNIEREAHELLANREHRLQVDVLQQERRDNARTALMEALTASGHLSEVRLVGTVEEINTQVLTRLLNGWDDTLPDHEQSRRFMELCNELFIQRAHDAILTGQLPLNTEILEISDYPEALADTRIGYRHQNKKGMVRSTGLQYNGDGTYTRVIEQISRTNGTWPSTFGFLNGCGIRTESGETDLAALKTPVLYSRHDYVDGVVDTMRLLDTHAGPNVRYGDTGDRATTHPAYDELRYESKRREDEIECFIDDLANLEGQLDDWAQTGRISQNEKGNIFKEEIDRILSAICTLNPDYASDTFGNRSQALFDKVSVLAASGQHGEAAGLLAANSYLKDEVTFCGVTISVEKAQELGLSLTSYGKLLEKGKESWRWKNGKCRVPNCPRPKPTKIGPCSVCRTCQHYAEKGANLMTLYKPRKVRDTTKKTGWLTAA